MGKWTNSSTKAISGTGVVISGIPSEKKVYWLSL